LSKIGTVYSAIVAQIEALYPSKLRLHNPYELTDNPEIVCKDSWGLRVEDANREDLEFCNLSVTRTFTIVFLRQFITLASKEDGFDTTTVNLLEDQQTFLNSFYSPDEINQQTNIDRIDFSGITGVREMTSNEKKYLFSEVTFTITISELIS
jgi:hypothetical protein